MYKKSDWFVQLILRFNFIRTPEYYIYFLHIYIKKIVIVTFRTNKKILFKCLDAINFSAHVLIVENSNDSNFKQILESKYSNLNVVLSGKNLGYGAGNNFGLERVKTKYALILNPDVIVEKNFFEEMNIYFEKKIDFHLMGSSQINNKFDSAGFFNDIDKKMKFKNEKKISIRFIGFSRLDCWLYYAF